MIRPSGARLCPKVPTQTAAERPGRKAWHRPRRPLESHVPKRRHRGGRSKPIPAPACGRAAVLNIFELEQPFRLGSTPARRGPSTNRWAAPNRQVHSAQRPISPVPHSRKSRTELYVFGAVATALKATAGATRTDPDPKKQGRPRWQVLSQVGGALPPAERKLARPAVSEATGNGRTAPTRWTRCCNGERHPPKRQRTARPEAKLNAPPSEAERSGENFCGRCPNLFCMRCDSPGGIAFLRGVFDVCSFLYAVFSVCGA